MRRACEAAQAENAVLRRSVVQSKVLLAQSESLSMVGLTGQLNHLNNMAMIISPVGMHKFVDGGSLHFDDDLLPVERGAVHLPEGGCGEGRRVEGVEELVDLRLRGRLMEG